MSEIPFREPGRRTPAKGVHVSPGGPNWVFLPFVPRSVKAGWHTLQFKPRSTKFGKKTATAWLVTDYLLMPDHLHLFCGPCDLKFTIERWIAFWKDRFTKTHPNTGTFQAGGFHRRLRDGESYAQKWQYVQENPVRAGLVTRPEDWPYFGRVHDIQWSGD